MAEDLRRRRAAEVQSGAARAAILGVNDGLVTNVALILGLMGASAGPQIVRLTGLASLVAGACSMAVGEYVSMAAQVELLQSLLAEEREALRLDPEGERRTLEHFIEKEGVSHGTAREASKQIARVPAHALATYARSIGLNPEELGSPVAAALTSLATFAGGALAPLLPWFYWEGTRAVLASVAVTGAVAAAIGAALGRMSGRGAAWPALRQLLIVAAAAALTWGVGHLFHVTVA